MVFQHNSWNLICLESYDDFPQDTKFYYFHEGIFKQEINPQLNNAYWVYYQNSIKSNINISKVFQEKRALFLLGDVSYYGIKLTSHYQVANQTKNWLIDNRGFSEDKIDLCDQNTQALNKLNEMEKYLQLPNRFAIIWYTGHCYRKNSTEIQDSYQDEVWDKGPITDNMLTNLIKNTHKDSQIVIIADNCFSDGMIDQWKINNQRNWLFISSSRENGSDEYTSAFFTGDGGFMTYTLINQLKKKYYNRDELIQLLHDEYYHENGGINLHKPKIYPNNTIVLW